MDPNRTSRPPGPSSIVFASISARTITRVCFRIGMATERWRGTVRVRHSTILRSSEGLELLGVDEGGTAFLREDYYQMVGEFEHLAVAPDGRIIEAVRKRNSEGVHPELSERTIPFTPVGTVASPKPPSVQFPFELRGTPLSFLEGPETEELTGSPLPPIEAGDEDDIRHYLRRLAAPYNQPDAILGRKLDRVTSESHLGGNEYLVTRETVVVIRRLPEFQSTDLQGCRWTNARLAVNRLQFLDIGAKPNIETLPVGWEAGEFAGPLQIVFAAGRWYVADSGAPTHMNRLHILERVS
jgi:hypothetical protein